MTGARLVVMTGEQHDALIRIYELQPPDVIRELLVAWDNAPTDPAEAVSNALEQLIADDEAFASACENVLRALGWESS